MRRLFVICAFALSIKCSRAQVTTTGPLSPWQTLKLVTHIKDTIDYQLSMLRVPENRLASNSKSILLKVVKLPSKAHTSLSPVVFLAGGPGQSGVNYLREEYFQRLVLKLQQNRDVILLDQRGSGGSLPSLVYKVKHSDISDIFLSPDRIIAVADYQSKAGADTMKARGIDVRGYNTVQSANDLNDLRIALGVNKISLLAISYGTHLALAAARQHPADIDQMVLIGTSGPNNMHHLPSTYQKQLEKISALAAKDTSVNRLVPDMMQLLKQVLTQLEKKPIHVQIKETVSARMVDIPIGKFGLQFILRLDAGDTYDIIYFPTMLYGIANGDYSLVTEYAEKRYNQLNGEYGSAIGLMRTASGATKLRYRRIEREGKTTLLENAMNTPDIYGKNYWGDIDLGDGFRSLFKSDVRTLFISGSLDSNTPPSNAKEVSKRFKNSSSILVKYAGHEDMLPNEEVQDAVFDYLNGSKIPNQTINTPVPAFEKIRN